jgi:hypothetical protein
MMRVEILGLDDTRAICKVTDDQSGEACTFTCGSGQAAHDALRLMVHNAARQLGERIMNRELVAFGRMARE